MPICQTPNYFFFKKISSVCSCVQLGSKRTIVRSGFTPGLQAGDEENGAACVALRYRTIVKSEVRKKQNFPASRLVLEQTIVHFHTRPQAAPNNYSFYHLGSRPERTNGADKERGRSYSEQLRTPNKSESPSPKARLVKPDDLRDTEHTKCMRYLWAFMLSCSISIGSLWVFVASFMRFWASV